MTNPSPAGSEAHSRPHYCVSLSSARAWGEAWPHIHFPPHPGLLADVTPGQLCAQHPPSQRRVRFSFRENADARNSRTLPSAQNHSMQRSGDRRWRNPRGRCEGGRTDDRNVESDEAPRGSTRGHIGTGACPGRVGIRLLPWVWATGRLGFGEEGGPAVKKVGRREHSSRAAQQRRPENELEVTALPFLPWV